MMKLSEDLLSAMKHFSSINSSIVLKKGNIQKSMSPDKTILVEAEFPDSFPVDFGVYDLNQFLGNITTLNDPDLAFNTKTVVMNDGQMKLEYYSCSPNLIISPPDKELIMKNVDATFVMTNSVLQKMIKLATMNSLPHISINGKSGMLVATASDKKNDSSNTVTAELGSYTGDDFDVAFKVDNLKMVPDDYDVDIAISGFAKFVSKTRKLKYYVAMESK